jgi:hypothetical protein
MLRKMIYGVALICLGLMMPADALTGSRSILLSGGGIKFPGPGSPGWKSANTSTFQYQNFAQESAAFSTAPWVSFHNIAPAVVLTSGQIDPQGGTTAWLFAFPAVNATNSASMLNQPVTGTGLQQTQPFRCDFDVKGVSGGEQFYIAFENASGSNITQTLVTAPASTTTWGHASLTFQITTTQSYIIIGSDLRFSNPESNTVAASVYIANYQCVQDSIAWPPVANNTAAPGAVQSVTMTLPSGMGFRDFTGMTAYPGVTTNSPNTQSYNTTGTDGCRMQAGNVVGTTVYCMTENSTVGINPNNLALYSASITNPTGTVTAPASASITGSQTWKAKPYMTHPTIVHDTVCGQWDAYYGGETSGGTASVGVSYASTINGTYTDYASNPVLTGLGQAVPFVIQINNTMYMFLPLLNVSTGTGALTITWYSRPAGCNESWTYGGTALRISTSNWWNGLLTIDPFCGVNKYGFLECIFTGFNTGASLQSLGYAVASLSNPTFWYPYQPGAIVGNNGSNDFPGNGGIYEDLLTNQVYISFVRVINLSNTYGNMLSLTDH